VVVAESSVRAAEAASSAIKVDTAVIASTVAPVDGTSAQSRGGAGGSGAGSWTGRVLAKGGTSTAGMLTADIAARVAHAAAARGEGRLGHGVALPEATQEFAPSEHDETIVERDDEMAQMRAQMAAMAAALEASKVREAASVAREKAMAPLSLITCPAGKPGVAAVTFSTAAALPRGQW
jgi:uncharacterized coiled-coil protein SlyX